METTFKAQIKDTGNKLMASGDITSKLVLIISPEYAGQVPIINAMSLLDQNRAAEVTVTLSVKD